MKHFDICWVFYAYFSIWLKLTSCCLCWNRVICCSTQSFTATVSIVFQVDAIGQLLFISNCKRCVVILRCGCKNQFNKCTITQLQVIVCRCSLTIKYKLYCDANYYSSDCSVYCVANDTDAGGHYTCDPITGNIICRQGTLIEMSLVSMLMPGKYLTAYVKNNY